MPGFSVINFCTAGDWRLRLRARTPTPIPRRPRPGCSDWQIGLVKSLEIAFRICGSTIHETHAAGAQDFSQVVSVDREEAGT